MTINRSLAYDLHKHDILSIFMKFHPQLFHELYSLVQNSNAKDNLEQIGAKRNQVSINAQHKTMRSNKMQQKSLKSVKISNLQAEQKQNQ